MPITEKPTYKRTQEYIKEKYGFKVHSKYIAKVKRKYGLEMYEAPNKIENPKRNIRSAHKRNMKLLKMR